MNSELSFKGGNPGASQYGNFINYYSFHPPEGRINLLPTDIWQVEHCVILDIGCNAGELTNALFTFFSEKVTANCHILGIDIDPMLIKRAKEKFGNTRNGKVDFLCLDFMDKTKHHLLNDYLRDQELEKFSVVFCFSITMWIHLNNGDDGLKRFLSEVSKISYILVVEPQPWKCYKTALKRMRLCNFEFPLFKTLKITNDIEDVIERYLEEECNMQKIKESVRTEWGRKLVFYFCRQCYKTSH